MKVIIKILLNKQEGRENCFLFNIYKYFEHMGHQDQDGGKMDECHFFLKVRGWYGQRKAKIHTLSSPTILSYLVQY